MNNYRGISLLSCVFKLYERVILSRIKKTVDFEIVEEQAGFREGRDCTDQNYILFETLCSRASENKKTFAAFIDIRKAFDTV